MTKKQLSKARTALKKLEGVAAEISIKRDLLRQAFGDFEEIMSNVDDSSECLESGMREIEDAIETLSRNL